ncbi:MAG: serine/threonine protein kinase [uncultured Frankineae bacterium]|uniref:non-specific serine/threonine protein kinase n=1 Tax=uncultured Frankineae bacterium TaxID=437475 RepID=A0A6J4M421_9ACTN|nr:MAG: serine/threonine protein kinase [uncultured Frankineae bacterium]
MTDPTQAMPAGGEKPVVVASRYRLLSLLGRGGTAEVWRAEDEALARDVALKLVTVPTDDSAARAGEEARLLARLNHPGLVPVYDAGTDERGHPWVVMELVEGETLADTLKRGPLPPARTAAIGSSLAAALAYVHGKGLLHRDVKPANILMGTDGRVRLTDFGIARLVDSARVTSTGMMVGTASYLAPEQVAGEPVGPAADVYALGLVLLESLTGQREYAGSTVEVALARLHRPPQVPATLPAGWQGLLRAMTDREPAARPTPAQAATALDDIARGGAATTVIAPPPSVERTTVLPRTAVAPAPSARTAPAPAAPRPVPQPRRSSAPYVVVLLVLVAALAAAAYAVSTRETVLTPLPEVSSELPDTLRSDLQRLRDAAERLEER